MTALIYFAVPFASKPMALSYIKEFLLLDISATGARLILKYILLFFPFLLPHYYYIFIIIFMEWLNLKIKKVFSILFTSFGSMNNSLFYNVIFMIELFL